MITKRKKIIILLITIIVLAALPFLPYKRAAEINNSKYLNTSNYIQLKVKYAWTGEMQVLDGEKDFLQQFITESGYENVTSSNISITGNTPYKSLTTFRDGIPQYTVFEIFGYPTKELDSDGPDKRLVFNVEEWYPEDSYVPLIDTYFWENYIEKPYLILLISTILILVLSAIRKVFFRLIKG
ncbi:MAG: hypothetical protein AB6733_03125 [Clostridiaceae bacterium]